MAPFDTTIRDGRATRGLAPDKTNWARPIDQPPFTGFPLRPGITFTYLGVAVDENAVAQLADGRAAYNVYAAGEIMAGNVLGRQLVKAYYALSPELAASMKDSPAARTVARAALAPIVGAVRLWLEMPWLYGLAGAFALLQVLRRRSARVN